MARHFAKGLRPGDRAAIYTISSRPTLAFTSDRAKLEEAVAKLKQRPSLGHAGTPCPDVSYYLADLILNKGDQQAFEAVVAQTLACARVPRVLAEQIAESAVRQ